MVITRTSEMRAELEIKRLKVKLNIVEKQMNNLIMVIETEDKMLEREEIASQLLNIVDFASME